MLVLELTRRTDGLMVPTLVGVVEATVIARLLGAHSIYSARLAPTAEEITSADVIGDLDATGASIPPSPV